ncbi:class I SAM-dependent methyltransferase [Rugamonas rivuli]|uniref:Methyltransferase n=1 Tax=Rugamonas rivuli TaxID=2743358 RepID=A0A843SGH5_9BURK|nr:class I SAM-dependent methyltransferase [Rugamonas rivuli]MQA19747.1 methyltransferase [Rugamonas rivuli]
MTDWTSGYVADIGYTYGCYDLLNPLRVKLALLKVGVVLPQTGTACELGFGQGVSANVHAAASATQWYGTDFNPAQAGYAQELAACVEDGPQLFDQSFAEFCSRTDLPDFDFIGLHGIWSWISDENRAIIVDFVRRKLKVGGVMYVSYNTQPGFAAMVPMRNLMTQHAAMMSPPGAGVVARVESAMEFANKLIATNPLFSRINPQVTERLKVMKDQDRNYLAHEYFNRDWQPMSFSDMAGWLADAKMDFACSATYSELVHTLNVTPEQRAMLNEIPDTVLRESVYDFMINQMFRRDYWVKGKRRLQPMEYVEQVRELHVVLCEPASIFKPVINGALGEAQLNESIYLPIVDLMADHAVRTLGEIEQSLQSKGITLNQVHEACLLLVSKGAMAVAQSPAATALRRPHTDRLNQRLLRQARGGSEVTMLASPVTGSGVPVARIRQLFISAVIDGKESPQEWAQHAWHLIKSSQQNMSKQDGTPLSDEEQLLELNTQAIEFRDNRLALLRALGIV